MSFFENEEGESLEPSNTFEVGGFQPLIEDETKLNCIVVGASWEDETEFRPIIVKVQLMVTEKGKYKDFVVNDNLKIADPDSKKATKAKQKLLTYDNLGNGLLAKADKDKKDIFGDTLLLEKSLCGTPILATFKVWEMTIKSKTHEDKDKDEVRSGNYVSKIEMCAKDKKIVEKAEEIELDGFDDSIPF